MAKAALRALTEVRLVPPTGLFADRTALAVVGDFTSARQDDAVRGMVATDEPVADIVVECTAEARVAARDPTVETLRSSLTLLVPVALLLAEDLVVCRVNGRVATAETERSPSLVPAIGRSSVG